MLEVQHWCMGLLITYK